MGISSRNARGPLAALMCLMALPVAAQQTPLIPASAPILAQASAQFEFAIGGGPLGQALMRFSRITGVDLVFDGALDSGAATRGVAGQHTVSGALDALLAGTGMQWRFVDASTVVLWRHDSDDSARMLDPVRVQGHVVDLRDNMYQTPGAVSVVTREEIDRLPPRNTGDVLASVPGVYTSQSRQNPGVSVNLRGLQDFGRVNVMIDGTRQNFQQSGHGSNGSVYIDPEMLGGVDIAKGPTSTLGGAGVIGGVVNFRTLGFDDLVREGRQRGGRLNLTTGDNAYHFSGSLAYAERVQEDVDLVAAVGRKNIGEFERGTRGSPSGAAWTHGTSRLSAQDQWSGLFKADWRLSPEQRLHLGYVGLDAQFAEGSSLGQGEVNTLNQVRSDTLRLGYALSPQDVHWLDAESTVYYTRTRNKVSRNPGMLDDNGYQLQYQTSTVGGTLENSTPFQWGRQSALLTVGGEIFHDWTEPEAQSLTVGSDPGTTALYTGATPEGKRSVASLFTALTLMRDDWLEIRGGLRWDWYGLQGQGLMRVGSITNPPGVRPGATTIYTRFSMDRHDAGVAPSLMVAVKPVQPLQLFASYAEGMRPPAITESLLWGSHTGSLFPYYPNPMLREERSRNIELGANLMFDDVLRRDDALRLKAVWFDTRVEHYITLARIMSPISTSNSGVMGPFAYVNMRDPFRSRGLELQADYDAGVAFVEVAYTRAIIDTGKGGYDPFPLGSLTGYPGTSLGSPGDPNIWYVLPPRRNVAVGSGVRLFNQQLTLGARMRYQSPAQNSSQWITDDDAQNTRHIYDAWASWQAHQRLTLRLAVNNLRDTHYTEMNGTNYWVAPGRTVTASLSLIF